MREKAKQTTVFKKHLADYNFPEALKEMSEADMKLLSYEIRDFLISSVAKTGGHLAPNLGVVELTIAIHRVFDLYQDKLIWDVGHQSYVHKILTGRAAGFETLRQFGGLSGFPKRSENLSDTYDSGHSSSSISAATGIATARDIKGEDYHVLAVIGDGAMTGGLAYEGINNAGHSGTRMTVILNDNEMSISENTGSLSQHLSHLRASKTYQDMKHSLKRTIIGIPGVGERLYRGLDHMRDLMRYAVISESIFEDMGFKYYGPVDGHDLHELIEILEASKYLDGPVLIHVVTRKGKGYRNAEQHPERFHGIGPFETETGHEIVADPAKSPDRLGFSTQCCRHFVELAETDPQIVAVTAAMAEGTGLAEFAGRFPERCFDVGIAEAHAVVFAAGLALGGLHPFVFIYSTFLQRAYDHIISDVVLQQLPVVFMIDRAGLVGADGETHHGIFDLSYLSHMPGLTVLTPVDGNDLMLMMNWAVKAERPVAIRYPKDLTAEVSARCKSDAHIKALDVRKEIKDFPGMIGTEGKDSVQTRHADRENIDETTFAELKSGGDILILAVGAMTQTALMASDILEESGIGAAVTAVRKVSPLDKKGLMAFAAKGVPILTVEDNVLRGGFGETAAACVLTEYPALRALHSQLSRSKPEEDIQQANMKCLGWEDEFIPHGGIAALRSAYGLDAEGIAKAARAFLAAGGKTASPSV